MMWWGGDGWGGWIPMTISMIVFWGAVIALVAWVVRRPDSGRGPARPDPKTILEERFARGEIDREELEERRRVLEEH